MAVIQCKICGGEIEIPSELTCGECPYCNSVTTFPKQTSDKKVQLYKRAEQLRHASSFDRAAATYEEIIKETPDDADAYWGLVLSNWGIEYVEDPLTKERKPTCHRVQFESILSDVNYKLAMDNAQPEEAEIYRREAQRIAEIQKDILRISSQEKPFDIFICYKETDESGQRTRDSVMAQDIYYNLTEQGYKVFFSRITLEDKLGQEYEPYIFAALNSAKVMLVLGTKKEFFEAVWVKNEWSRFLSLMKKDKSKLMIPCYRDMDAYDLPEELTMLQSQDMGKIGFLQDIIRGVQKVLPNQDSQKNTSKPLPRAIPVAPATIPVHSEISPKVPNASDCSVFLDKNEMKLGIIRINRYFLFLVVFGVFFIIGFYLLGSGGESLDAAEKSLDAAEKSLDTGEDPSDADMFFVCVIYPIYHIFKALFLKNIWNALKACGATSSQEKGWTSVLIWIPWIASYVVLFPFCFKISDIIKMKSLKLKAHTWFWLVVTFFLFILDWNIDAIGFFFSGIGMLILLWSIKNAGVRIISETCQLD